MTVSVPGSLTYSYSADGVTTSFSYPVKFLEPLELVVVREAADGTQTTLSYGVHYTVSGAGATGGGSVAIVPAPVGGKVILYRSSTAKQIVDMSDSARTPAKAVEQQLDRLAMVAQDQSEMMKRAVKVRPGKAAGDVVIADVALTGSYADLKNIPESFVPSAHTHSYDSLTGKPTTLSGFGITDAATAAAAVPSGGATGQTLRKSSNANYALEWGNPPGGGDMLAAAYDPANKAANVYGMENMVEATDAKIMTAAERSKLAATSITFQNKASAEAYTFSAAPDFIVIAGYASAGDGGGALYKKVAVQPTHAGKLSITLLGGAVVWYELAEEVFTPKNFGIRIAPDDASTDIQRALDAAAEKGSAVRIPPGTYWAKNITLKAPVYGVPGATTIKCLSGATQLFSGASGTGPVLMRDLILDGNLEAVRALQCTENSKVRIKDVDWINWGGAWVADFLQGTRDVAINGGLFKGNKGSNNLVIRGQYGRVLSVRFEDIESHAIRFGRYNSDTAGNSGYYGSVIGCSFSNIRNDTVLLELDARWVVVSGNVAERVRRFIKAQSADASGIAGRLTVSNNIINGQVPAASDGVSLGAAIGIENAVIGAVVHDNQIYGFDQGITFGPQAIIHHNHLENITGRGMWGNGAADVQIDHNTFKNHTGDYAINPTGARANVSNNNIATTGTGIRLEGARSKAMFNDIAAATGIQLTSGAPTSQVGGNDLSRVTGTKVLDAATGTVSNPPNITA